MLAGVKVSDTECPSPAVNNSKHPLVKQDDVTKIGHTNICCRAAHWQVTDLTMTQMPHALIVVNTI